MTQDLQILGSQFLLFWCVCSMPHIHSVSTALVQPQHRKTFSLLLSYFSRFFGINDKVSCRQFCVDSWVCSGGLLGLVGYWFCTL